MFFFIIQICTNPNRKMTRLVTELIFKHYSMITEVKVKLVGETYL